jgi:hypothetical protein
MLAEQQTSTVQEAGVSHAAWALSLASLWPPQGEWTEHAYLTLPDSNRLIELSEGVVAIMPPPSYEHQKVLGSFYSLLKAFVQEHDLGEVAFAPLAVRLWPGKIREPDVLFYTHAHADRLGGTLVGDGLFELMGQAGLGEVLFSRLLAGFVVETTAVFA